MSLPRAGRLASWAILLLAGGGCGPPPVEHGDTLAVFTEHLNRRIPTLMQRYEVPGLAVALVREGEPVWSAAYGYADLEHGMPMTADAVFRAESVSKAVTAWGVMRLVEQGSIGLDDPVQRYLGGFRLPESSYSGEEVTVRRLLSHSAGMPLGPVGPPAQYAPGSDMPALREYLAGEARLVQPPGSGYLYSNVGFNLLELVVEQVTGREFAEFMAAEVLLPLGMRSSSFAWDETLDRRLATGYDLRGRAVPTYVYPASASGGLFTTAEDLARFVAAGITGAPFRDHRVLGPASVRALHAPQIDVAGIFGVVADAYGFGHFVEALPDGRQAVWVGGQGNGWMADFHTVPESGDALVILTNSQRSWPLMAHVLNDWSRWSGFAPVKWVRIAYGVTALWVLIALITAVTLAQLLRLVRGLRRGTRRWGPLARESRTWRLAQAAAAVAILAALGWSAAQPYLMVSSVFPGVSGWAGLSLFVLAGVAFLSALLPRVRTTLLPLTAYDRTGNRRSGR